MISTLEERKNKRCSKHLNEKLHHLFKIGTKHESVFMLNALCVSAQACEERQIPEAVVRYGEQYLVDFAPVETLILFNFDNALAKFQPHPNCHIHFLHINSVCLC